MSVYCVARTLFRFSTDPYFFDLFFCIGWVLVFCVPLFLIERGRTCRDNIFRSVNSLFGPTAGGQWQLRRWRQLRAQIVVCVYVYCVQTHMHQCSYIMKYKRARETVSRSSRHRHRYPHAYYIIIAIYLGFFFLYTQILFILYSEIKDKQGTHNAAASHHIHTRILCVRLFVYLYRNMLLWVYTTTTFTSYYFYVCDFPTLAMIRYPFT